MLPSYEYCCHLANRDDTPFTRKTETIEGYQADIFSYRMAKPEDFLKHSAHELRGITFIFNPDTHVWERHLSIPKFFNYGEYAGHKEACGTDISYIETKYDGSLIQLIRLPNGHIIAKTKGTFFSAQADLANKLLENYEYLETITHEQTPLFELIGPSNQHVLQYPEDQLHLLAIRRHSNGSFIRNEDNTAYEGSSIEFLRTAMANLKNEEGWIVRFDSGMTAKFKTDDYCKLHRLIGPDSTAEHLIIKHTLDETLDDIVSKLAGTRREKVEHIQNVTIVKFNMICRHLRTLISIVSPGESRKEIALEHKDSPYFSILTSVLFKGTPIDQAVKRYVLKQTDKLHKAQKWLKE